VAHHSIRSTDPVPSASQSKGQAELEELSQVKRTANLTRSFQDEERKGDAKTRKNVLPDLTSQRRKVKPLKKLRCKPQGSKVFRCGSMGIDAEPVDT
jgi:hypothetical protein